MKKLILLIVALSASTIQSQITLIPDEDFEQYLIDENIDTDGIINGHVLTTDIEDELAINVLGLQITDFTGIEDFASLELLYIKQIDIEEINISNNSNLKDLRFEDVSLTSLNISQNTELEQFTLSVNLSGGLYTSSISSVDFSNNTLIGSIIINKAELTSIDLSTNSGTLDFLRLAGLETLTSINLKNGQNEQLLFVRILGNDLLDCVQVDDPDAVIAGVEPPYDDWIIENNPTITDDCMLGTNDFKTYNIQVYPNPVSNTLYLDNVENVKLDRIVIYDVLGKKVFETNEHRDRLDLTHLDTGIFFVNIYAKDGKMLVERIMKE